MLYSADVNRQFAELEIELSALKQTYGNLKTEYTQKCSVALAEAIESLKSVVKYVNKADKNLVYWYEKGDNMKLALRCIGVDKRTSAVIKTETRRIKGKAAETEAKFEHSSEVVGDGLKAMQDMNKKVNKFSLTSIGGAQNRANEAYNDIDGDMKSVQRAIEEANVEHRTAQQEIDEIPRHIAQAESSQADAQQRSDNDSAVAASSLFIAGAGAVASFLFPPAALVAGAAGAFGVGNAISSGYYSSQVDSLRIRQSELHTRLGSLKDQINDMEQSSSQLNNKRSELEFARRSIVSLQNRGESLQTESNIILDDLLQIRTLLSTLTMKIQTITTRLSEVGYANTRREIAERLREVVVEIQSSQRPKGITYSSTTVASISTSVKAIEGRTLTVMMAMNNEVQSKALIPHRKEILAFGQNPVRFA